MQACRQGLGMQVRKPAYSGSTVCYLLLHVQHVTLKGWLSCCCTQCVEGTADGFMMPIHAKKPGDLCIVFTHATATTWFDWLADVSSFASVAYTFVHMSSFSRARQDQVPAVCQSAISWLIISEQV